MQIEHLKSEMASKEAAHRQLKQEYADYRTGQDGREAEYQAKTLEMAAKEAEIAALKARMGGLADEKYRLEIFADKLACLAADNKAKVDRFS